MPFVFCRRGVVQGADESKPGHFLIAWLDQTEITSHRQDELRIEKHMSDWRGL